MEVDVLVDKQAGDQPLVQDADFIEDDQQNNADICCVPPEIKKVTGFQPSRRKRQSELLGLNALTAGGGLELKNEADKIFGDNERLLRGSCSDQQEIKKRLIIYSELVIIFISLLVS
ncbi:hypothetical protein ACHAPC_011099 [Botrytis cinerea]